MQGSCSSQQLSLQNRPFTSRLTTTKHEAMLRPRGSLVTRLFFLAVRPSVVQGLVVIGDQGLSSVTNFLTGVLIARACTKAEYGLFVLGFALMRLAISVQDSLISIPYTIEYPRCDERRRKSYLGSTLTHQWITCLVISAGLAVASPIVSVIFYNEAFAEVLLMLSVASFALSIREFMRLVMLAELRVWTNLAMGLAANVLTVGSLLVAYLSGSLNSPRAFLIVACCSGIPALAAVLLHWKRIRIIKQSIWKDVQTNWKHGKWLFARVLANTGALTLYPFLVAAMCGTAKAGVYGACMSLAALLNPLFMGMTSFLRPKMAHAATRDLSSVRRLALAAILILVLPVGLIIFTFLFFGNAALVHVFGEGYAGYGHVLVLCAMAIGASAFTAPLVTVLDAFARTDIAFRGRMVGVLATASIGLPLIWMGGLPGAALGLLVSQLMAGTYWGIALGSIHKSTPTRCLESNPA